MKRTCLRRDTNTDENSKHGVPYDHKKRNYLRMKCCNQNIRAWLEFFSLLLLLASCHEADLVIVKNGEPNAFILVPDSMNQMQEIAVNDFRQIIRESTGAYLPLIRANKYDSISARKNKIIIGPSKLTQQLGFSGDSLKTEEFHIHFQNNNMIVLAEDVFHKKPPPNIFSNKESENSRVTQWALGHILDRFVGVRWLWPGKLGTYIPKHETIAIPKQEIVYQQPLMRRSFNVVNQTDENLKWLGYHHFGSKPNPYHFRHSFTNHGDNGDFWNDFKDVHPEYLAQNPEGKISLFNDKKDFYKLCISEAGVADEIIMRWEEAGMPDYWDVTPNDGKGFCTCSGCSELDLKYGGHSYTKEEIWNQPPHVQMTDRYVWFWNKLIARMREKNPDVKIGIFIYSGYRNPPINLKLKPGIVGLMVHGPEFKHWKAWQEAGITEIGLRPNWLYTGAAGPHLPFDIVGSYIEKARNNQMALISMDCMHEYWATQGPMYYVIARLIARPDLNTTEIINEYISGFGKASEQIKKYLDYWDEYHQEVDYNFSAGGSYSMNPDGLYETLSTKIHGQVLGVLQGHWRMMPAIYNSKVLDGAYQILKEADEAAEDETVRQRVYFLRDGLLMVQVVNEYMTAFEEKENLQQALENLYAFNDQMEEKHGYWNSQNIFFLKWWGLIGEEKDVTGM